MLAPAEGREQFQMIGQHARQRQAAARSELGFDGTTRLINDLRALQQSNPSSTQQEHLPFRALAVFIAAMALDLRGTDQIKLPTKIDLSPLGATIRGMVKQQVESGKEHLKTIELDISTLQVHLSNSVVGSETNVIHSGKSLARRHFLAAGMLHTHPVVREYPQGYSLHFSPGDIFSFESNPGAISIVACQDGVLMALKSRNSITPNSALETLERLKAISMRLIKANVKNFPQKFTKLACQEFGYTLYMTRDLDELIVRRISLSE